MHRLKSSHKQVHPSQRDWCLFVTYNADRASRRNPPAHSINMTSSNAIDVASQVNMPEAALTGDGSDDVEAAMGRVASAAQQADKITSAAQLTLADMKAMSCIAALSYACGLSTISNKDVQRQLLVQAAVCKATRAAARSMTPPVPADRRADLPQCHHRAACCAHTTGECAACAAQPGCTSTSAVGLLH